MLPSIENFSSFSCTEFVVLFDILIFLYVPVVTCSLCCCIIYLRLIFFAGQEENLKYTLYGVLVHAGWSTHSGHYYCFVRTSTGMWYSLDDNRVGSNLTFSSLYSWVFWEYVCKPCTDDIIPFEMNVSFYGMIFL